MNVHDQMRAKLQAKLEVAQRQVKALKALLLVVDELEACNIAGEPALPLRPKRRRKRPAPPAPVEPVPCAGKPEPAPPAAPPPAVPEPQPQP